MNFFVPSQMVRFACSWAVIFTFSLTLSQCGKPTVVEWPALKEMDDWAEKGEAWADEGKVGEMRKALPELTAAGNKLLASAVPANARDPKAVAQTMGDFRDVISHLKKPGLSDDDLKVQVAAIHPLVASLMEASGLPHVHEHEEKEKK